MNQISLFSIFQSGMVLQRNKPIPIWGNAPANSLVTVVFNNASVQTTANINGDFQIILPPMEAGIGYTLSVTGSSPNTSPLILTDISIGDVWLAGGQSNMEFFLRYDKDWNSVQKYKNNPLIRVYNVPQSAFPGHTRNIPGYGRWMQSNDPDFETFSAPAYSFAYNLQPHINVPIGMIGCNWGGTTATAWIDESNLKNNPLDIYLKEYNDACSLHSTEEMKQLSMEGWKFEDSSAHDLEFRPLLYGRDFLWQKNYMENHAEDPLIPLGPYHINRPGGLYHMMLKPMIPLAMKGVIWYQGESDAGHADIYDVLLKTLITSWRKEWNDDFPFLFVQLAPFGVWLQCTSENYSIIRKKQQLVNETLSNTGMVSIMDIGSYYDIHPKEKMEVGRRLALLARGKVYGENILCESPEPVSAIRKDNKIILTFKHCSVLSATDKQTDFSIIQNDKIQEITKLDIIKNQILIYVKELTDAPITVNLAQEDYSEIHIYNEANLPIKPFTLTIS